MWKAFFIFFLFAVTPMNIYAAGLVPCGGPGEADCQSCHVVQLAQSGIDRLVGVLTIIVILILIVSGIRLVTSAGDASAVSASKKMITNALIGYVIVLVGWLLIDLGMKTLVNETAYGVWNEIQCVDQPIALVLPPLPDRPPRVNPGGPNGTPGVAGIPVSGTPSTSCTNCGSTPTNWIPSQTVPNGGGPGIDTTVGSLCQTQLAPDGQCVISNDLLPELNLFHNTVMSENISSWWVTEAWPPTGWSPTNPTGIHSHSCFSNGTCVKYYFVAGGIAGVDAINSIIGFAHQYGLLAIYEVKNQAEKDFLVRGGVSANSIQITGTDRPHFTIYILEPAGLAGPGTTPNSGLLGYCGEYYNGVDRAVPTDPAFTAYGLTKKEISLDEAVNFFQVAITENRVLPGPHLAPESDGRYLAIPITVLDSRSSADIRLFDVQGSPSKTANITASLSPCPGDFRNAAAFNSNNTDDYLKSFCRSNEGISGALKLGTDEFSCSVPVGEVMYLNVTNHRFDNGWPEPTCRFEFNGNCGLSFNPLPYPDGIYFE